MILIISTCSEKISYNEFVNPIANIVGKNHVIKHYSDVTSTDLENSQKIIICGTALKDDSYLTSLDNFEWITNYKKPILGICSGMQIIGLKFGARLSKVKEIGMIEIKVTMENKLFDKNFNAYSLHNNSLTNLDNFKVLAKSNLCVQAIKHNKKDIYGIIFHPEVRNINIVKDFLNLTI